MTIAVLGLCGVAVVGAQTENGKGDYLPIIQKLADKFNLNIDEVKEFFEENRTERIQEKLTKSGLTEEQIESLRAKKEELREEWGLLKDLSPEERRAKMQEIKEEMKSWAEENGIDSGALNGFGGRFGKGFNKGFRPWGIQNLVK